MTWNFIPRYWTFLSDGWWFPLAKGRQSRALMPWWRHQMETFSALLAICAGYSPVPGEFPTQRPVTQSFDVYFDLHPNKRLSKQWWGWRFETQSCLLWSHRNAFSVVNQKKLLKTFQYRWIKTMIFSWFINRQTTMFPWIVHKIQSTKMHKKGISVLI